MGGGLIEDRIQEVLADRKMTVSQATEALRNLRPPCERKRGTIDRHMRKMYKLCQLERVYRDVSYCYSNAQYLR